MNSAHHIVEDMAGAPGKDAPIVVSIGALPTRQDTVIADVLSQLLRGKTITGMGAVSVAHTTRLADVIFRLYKGHGWTIQRLDSVVGCKDGRTTTISKYFLDPSAIAAAQLSGSIAWCAEVRAARAILRTKAADAQRRAVQANAASSARRRRRASSELQADMFAPHV